jgi:hypothetical protein
MPKINVENITPASKNLEKCLVTPPWNIIKDGSRPISEIMFLAYNPKRKGPRLNPLSDQSYTMLLVFLNCPKADGIQGRKIAAIAKAVNKVFPKYLHFFGWNIRKNIS